MNTISRRTFLQGTVGVTGAISLGWLLDACQIGSSSPGAKTSLVILQPAVALGADWEGSQNASPATEELESQTYQGLVDYVYNIDPSGVYAPDFTKPTGALAESWEQSGLDWTFHLRQGVMSPAGNEFTADDVIWTFARDKNVGGVVQCGWFLLNAGSVFDFTPVAKGATAADKMLKNEVVKIDKYTVKIHQYETNEVFPGVLAVFCCWIIDSTEAMKHATSDDPWAYKWLDSGGTAGFGRYSLQSWDKGNSVVLQANPYYKSQLAYDTITIRSVPASANRIAAIESGQADAVTDLSPNEFNQVSASGKAVVLNWIGNTFLSLGLNYGYQPWGGGGNPDKARLVRQAIAQAIPYDQIVNQAFFGSAKKWNGLISSTFYGATTYPNKYAGDLNMAKQLLAQAGYPNGAGISGPGLELVYVAEEASIFEPIATFIQTALAQIGIQIQLNPLPQSQYSDRYSTKRDLPMFLNQNASFVADAGYMAQVFYVSTANGGLVGAANYKSAAFDAAYLKQKGATGSDRIQLLQAMQDILIQDLPEIPLVEPARQIALRKGLTRWSPRAEKAMNMWTFRNS